MESNVKQRFIQTFSDETNNGGDDKPNMLASQFSNKTNDPFPFAYVVGLTSLFAITLLIIGLAITRFVTYLKRYKQGLKESSYEISKYYHRQTSISLDSINPLSKAPNNNSDSDNSQMNQEANEMSRIIKNSFSWPEATLIQQQKQKQHEQDDYSSTISSSLSNSSTIEHFYEPALLMFGIRWNDTTGSLFVRVISAQYLFVHRRHRQSSLIDSYVRVELISINNDNTHAPFQSMRTHIVKKNADPIYDELFEFSNILQLNHAKNLSLLFTILTYDTFTRDEILGQVVFPVILPDEKTPNALDTNEVIFKKDITPRHKQQHNQQLGQMLISLCYQPIDSVMTLIVLKASNLPRIGTTRLINPYFKIYMFYKGQRIIKKRSTIKRSTQCPVFNECFTFNIPDNDLQNIHFEIILFDYDQHMKHEPVGTFSIGNNTGEINQHWVDVCHRQIAKQIAQWYQLKAFNILNY